MSFETARGASRILGVRSLALITAGCLAAIPVLAESAFLECVADGAVFRDRLKGKEAVIEVDSRHYAVFDFRRSLIEGWSVEQATLLLRVREGVLTGNVQVATRRGPWSEREATWTPERLAWRDCPVEPQPDRWIAVRIPGELIRDSGLVLRSRKGKVVIDARESIYYQPRLLVEGRRRPSNSLQLPFPAPEQDDSHDGDQ